MSITLYRGINKQIDKIIRCKEFPFNFYKKDETISVYNIFEAEKNRNIRKIDFCKEIIEELKKTRPNIDNVVFLGDEKNNIITIVLDAKDGKRIRPIVIDYSKENGFSFNHRINGYENEKTIAFEKNKKYFEELANYGINNNLHKSLKLATISNEFKVSSDGRDFYIGMTSELMHILNKSVSLYYYFNQDKEKNKIITQEGIFNIYTNVPGIKKLFSSSMNEKYFKNEELNNTIRFLQNLKVFEKDVPEYLIREIETGNLFVDDSGEQKSKQRIKSISL